MLQAVDSMVVPGCSLATHESSLSRCFRAYWVFNFCGALHGSVLRDYFTSNQTNTDEIM
jgi:hypothetical protein